MKTAPTKPLVSAPSFHLSTLPMDRLWPVLPLPLLHRLELEQDPLYPYLTPEQVETCCTEAVQFGQQVAQKEPAITNWLALYNQWIRTPFRIQKQPLSSASQTALTAWERWRRRRRRRHRRQRRRAHTYAILFLPQTLVQPLQAFFQLDGLALCQEELGCLLLCQPWFYQLEAKKYGYTYQKVPRATIRRLGLWSNQQPIRRASKIAAAAFTQQILQLDWSPLLLEHLLPLQQKGWSKLTIREHFAQLLRNPPSVNPST